jgi:hypothetical protein
VVGLAGNTLDAGTRTGLLLLLLSWEGVPWKVFHLPAAAASDEHDAKRSAHRVSKVNQRKL